MSTPVLTRKQVVNGQRGQKQYGILGLGILSGPKEQERCHKTGETREGHPCEYLTYGGKCSLKFYLLQESYEEVVKSCPLKKKVLLAGNDCYHIGAEGNW